MTARARLTGDSGGGAGGSNPNMTIEVPTYEGGSFQSPMRLQDQDLEPVLDSELQIDEPYTPYTFGNSGNSGGYEFEGDGHEWVPSPDDPDWLFNTQSGIYFHKRQP